MPVNMQELKFKVLEFIRLRGPVIPVQISKQIGSNILFAGAVLSELLNSGKIKISSAKIGGSPVYYFPGQEPRLNILYGYLNQREKQAYDLLKDKKTLKDKSLQPVERVALREIKDFAYFFQINDEIYWRWYLINEEEARSLVFQNIENEMPKEIVSEAKEIKQEIIEEKPAEIEQAAIDVQEKPTIKFESKKEIIQKTEKKKIKKEVKAKDFDLILKNYLSNKDIKIIEENIVKKGKEFDYVIEISSRVGNIRMFLSAKDKKKINDADLSICHNKSQLKKLPLMVLTNGDLTKQAKEYINNNYLIYEKI